MTINNVRLVPAFLGAVFTLTVMPIAPSHAQSAAILSMGDSITSGTRGQCGYKRILSQNLLNNPSCDVSFVGPVATSSGDFSKANCAAVETNHAGVPGRRADDFTLGRIGNWSTTYGPDYFLVHIGSNDIFEGETIEQIMVDIDLVRARIADRAPAATMLLANLIPWDPVSPDPSHIAFDNADVDELAMSAALSAAIGSYVTDSNNPRVKLVDVRSGFDNSTMTIDGVHPNDLGEAHVAERFQQALADVDVCDVIALPTKTMAANNWYQLSLPANPNSLNTVKDIFDNLPADDYGTTWQVFGWDPNQSTSERIYTDLGLNGVMSQGRAYWAIQALSPSVVIDMPVGSTLTPLAQGTECTSPAGCYGVPLLPENTPLMNATEGAFDWDMAGYPHFQASRFSDTRITTPSTGPCSGEQGCTPAEALNNQVMNSTIFRYNDSNNTYDSISDAAQLLPWDGFWVPVLSQGADGNSVWVTSPE